MFYGILFTVTILVAWGISCLLSEKGENIFMDRYCTNIMKGVAILCIVMCHMMGTFGSGIVYFTPLGGIGVSIFLILSAYGLNESWNRGGHYNWWCKRIIAVIIPYTVVQCVLYWPFHEFIFKDFLMDIFCIKPLYANGWYLSYLVLWYVIFYTVKRLKVLRGWEFIVFFCISIVMFFGYTYLQNSPIRAEQSFAFVFGIFLSEMKDRKFMKKIISVKVMVCCLCMGVIALAIKQLPMVRTAPQVIYNLVEMLIKIPCGFGAMQLAWNLSKKLNMKVFGGIGTIAYELYLIHGYVLSYVDVNWTGWMIFIVISFGSAGLMYKVKKMYEPYLRKCIFKNFR